MNGEVLSGRFHVERLLGRGGMSAVWLARDLELERQVAVKIVHVQRLERAEDVERFEREARVLASLAHPGIVTVIDRGDHEGRPYIVFEYVRGQDLRTRIAATGRLEPAVALGVCVQVADALAYAHEHGVIHRDVKPHNVLLTEDGVAKLTDFGIARMLHEPSLTATGRVLGTGEYLAPEQATGQALDERADVYALGVMLFHCLTGETPYQGEGFVDLAEQHLHAPVPVASDRVPELGRDLDAILARALAKRPEDRYVDCRAMRVDLERALATAAPVSDDTAELPVVTHALAIDETTAESTPLPYALPPPHGERRRYRIGSLLLLAAVVVLGAGGWAAYLLNRGGGEPEAASSTPPQGSGTTRPQAPPTEPVGSAAGPPAVRLAAIPGLVATTYDPAGDGSENAQYAPYAVDGSPTTAWSTEHYKGTQNVNGKGGVGLVLDAGVAVRANQLRLTVPVGGWKGRIYASAGAAPPATLAGWKAASPPFVVDTPATTVRVHGPAARFWLVWITDLTGPPNDWSAEIADARLLGPPPGA